jgi:hypothetical protein
MRAVNSDQPARARNRFVASESSIRSTLRSMTNQNMIAASLQSSPGRPPAARLLPA